MRSKVRPHGRTFKGIRCSYKDVRCSYKDIRCSYKDVRCSCKDTRCSYKDISCFFIISLDLPMTFYRHSQFTLPHY